MQVFSQDSASQILLWSLFDHVFLVCEPQMTGLEVGVSRDTRPNVGGWLNKV